MVIELRLQVGKLDTNEITINVIRCSVSASKSDYCISYITYNCFSIIIVCKYYNDIWGVAKI